jgi:simple sugar transport system substrate-binding protein
MKIAWFDSNGFSKAPEVIISSTQNLQEKLAEEVTLEWLEGKTVWGSAETVGMKEGYIQFVNDDPFYLKNVPQNIRDQMNELVNKIKTGELEIKL